MGKLTKRLTTMLLSSMLIIGSAPVVVFATDIQEDLGQTSEISEEVPAEEATEESFETVDAGAEAIDGDIAEAIEEASSSSEEGTEYNTITLDANGGYFVNEWDEATGDYVEKAEVIEKQIPVGGTVAVVPVFEAEGDSAYFLGWSLERDGELITARGEEYAPVDNCVLYAVWYVAETEDVSIEVTEGIADEITDPSYENNETEIIEAVEETETFQESEEAKTVEDIGTAQEYENTETAEEANTAQETVKDNHFDEDTPSGAFTAPGSENVQGTVLSQEMVHSNEQKEEINEKSFGTFASEEETNPSKIMFSEEEEVVTEDAALGFVANGTCGDNVTWTLDEKGVLTISGTGAMDDYEQIEKKPWSNLVIKKISISDAVTSIGSFAFSNCTNLTSITIPKSVTSIEAGAFEGCTSLTSITIPNSVTNIEGRVFEGCTSLTSVIISNSVKSIEYMTFNGCKSLTSITVPKGVTNIEEYAFWYCTSLTNINLPGSLTSIDYQAFYGCENLTSITIPDSVISIEDEAFDIFTIREIHGTSNSKAYKYARRHKIPFIPTDTNVYPVLAKGSYGTNVNWTINCAYELIISGKGEMKDDDSYPWSKYSENVQSIIIKSGITYIGSQAFYSFKNLLKVVLCDGVKIIGQEAFIHCYDLKNVKLPSSLTRINSRAFEDTGLASITIPNNVTRIGDHAFDCSELTSITLPDSVISIGDWAFDRCYYLTNITLSDNLTSIGNFAFYDCKSLTSITIPNSVTSIGSCCFKDCTNLTNVILPKRLTDIYHSTFSGCTSLSQIYIPPTVERIDDSAFNYYNKRLEREEPILGLTIIGYSGTEAQRYAKDNGIVFRSKSVSLSKASVSIPSQTYTGSALKPVVTVKLNGSTLKKGSDYTVSYKDNKNVGTATVTITGKIKYIGTKKATFTINKATQPITVKAGASSIAVGKTTTVSITGAKGTKSFKSSDTTIATVTSAGKVTAKKVGTVKITATSSATANYRLTSKVVTIKIVPASIAKAIVTAPASKDWEGWGLTPVPIVKVDGKTLKKGTDFTLAFKNNKNIGIAAIVITGKGNYNGTFKKTFQIVPKPTTISKITIGRGKLTVTWKKQTSQTNGYQIQYSSRSDFKTQKTIDVTSNKTTSKVLSDLTKKNKYYVRIRTYKTVGSTKYFSTWSATKTATTK